MRRETPCCGHLAQVGIGRGQTKLLELLKVEHLVHGAVIFLHNSISILEPRVQELFAHEVINLITTQLAIAIHVKMLKQSLWLKVRVPGQILSSHFNL